MPPPLRWAARSLGVPLVLWNHRFYDWVHAWTPDQAAQSVARAQAGDIVLLHDQQRQKNWEQFQSTLRGYIDGLKAKQLRLAALTNELVLGETTREERPSQK